MASNEQDILRDAMIGTENEIFGDAFGKEDVTLDDTGDRSREEMGEGLEGQHEDEDDEGDEVGGEEAEVGAKAETRAETTEPKPLPKAEDTPADGRLVPSSRLREQTERSRAIEAERDALKTQLQEAEQKRRSDVETLNAKFDTLMASLRGQQQPATTAKPADAPKPDAPPDLFENPQAFAEYVQKGAAAQVQSLSQQMDEMRINMSMENAHARHGAAFDSAFEAAKKLDLNAPQNREVGRRIRSSPNPGEALVQWHKQNEAIREVGGDPAAYKARIAEETRKTLMADPAFRRELLEGLRADAMTGDDGRPRTTTRLPASLNRATGGNTRAPNDHEMLDGSDSAIFDTAFAN